MAQTPISLIGIKKLYYGTKLSAVATPYVQGTAGTGLSVAELKAFIASAKEIPNVHGDTWNFEEPVPTVTDHKNKLTGQVYRQDIVPNPAKISFTVGRYDFAIKADLQGGTANDTKYSSPSSVSPVEKTVVGLTEDDVYIVLTRGNVLVGGKTTDNAIGLASEVVALEPTVSGLEAVAMITKAAVDTVV